MPNRDGTGPGRQGPLTGRGSGNCNGGGAIGRSGGRGLGFGRGGRGFGRGIGFPPEQERSWLEHQVQVLQSALQSITERLDALKKE
jgi:hypothetical protein